MALLERAERERGGKTLSFEERPMSSEILLFLRYVPGGDTGLRV